ncbi:toll-like receptor 6 [Anopheles aquasalis]|uniref:toll-like receptor 6 n=1 Tax=Anopheles aquasalis TaxID=42839 RepID=UPI00215B372C|nr:toll-like receptor 6 [Anopheles aquasalis]
MAHRKCALLGVAILALGVVGVSTTSTKCECTLSERCNIVMVDSEQLSTNAMECSLDPSNISDLVIIRYSDTVLKTNTFVHFPNLTMLEVYEGSMMQIEPGAFAKNPEIVKIIIQNNKLVTLEDNTFAGLNKLRELSLKFNNLTNICPGAFVGLENLQHLTLTANSLSQLHEALFQPTPKLTTIIMSENRLTNLPAGLFDPLSYVAGLELSHNQLQSFQFPKLNVEVLLVRNNLLTEVALNDHMVYLLAENNQISRLTGSGANLTMLILSDNAITDVTPLLGMQKLKKLSLNGNPLKPTSVFNDFEALFELNLGNTNIQITDQTFANLTQLELLDLSSNGLTQLDFHMFSSLTELEVLTVTYNRIEKFNFTELRENLPNLRVLEICWNGWNSTYLKAVMSDMHQYHLSADLQRLSTFYQFASLFVEMCSTGPNTMPASDKDGGLSEKDIIDKDFTTSAPTTTEKILRTTISTSTAGRPADSILASQEERATPINLDPVRQLDHKLPFQFPGAIVMAYRKCALLGVAILALGVAGVSTTSTKCECTLSERCNIVMVDSEQLSTNAMECSLDPSNISDLVINSYSDTTLKTNAFVHFTNLTMLQIFRGSMMQIEPGAFVKNSGIVKIVIQHNKLVSLEDNTFVELSKLRVLSLASNKLTSIGPDAFAGLENLQHLLLARNSLSQLPEPLFQPTPKLTTIIMSENRLTNLPAGLFDPLSYLSRLDLSYNQLQSFQFPMLNVELLQVQNNSLTEVALNDHMVYLKAERNHISSLTGTGANLTTLLLNVNAITDVTPLLGMKKLERLSLNVNPLRPTSVFNDFEALVQLLLRNTNIQITEHTFANLSHLNLLDLSSNGLTQLDFHMFSSLTELEVLTVTHNRIEKFNFTELRENLPNLRVLEICGNGWNSTYLKAVMSDMHQHHLSADLSGLSQFNQLAFVKMCSTAPNTTSASGKDDGLSEEDVTDKDFQET